MVPSVSAAEREGTGEREAERGFSSSLAGVRSPIQAYSYSSRPPVSQSPLLGTNRGYNRRLHSVINIKRLARPALCPGPRWCTALAEAAHCIPALAEGAMGKPKRCKKEGLRHQSVHLSHWLSVKLLVAPWEGSGRSKPRNMRIRSWIECVILI